MSEFGDTIAEAYAVEGAAIDFGRGMLEGEIVPDAVVQAPIAMMNRHGLIAGATGSGKTVTVQVIAEQLSAAGVSVFAADVRKADLTSPGVFATGLIAEALAREELPGDTLGHLDPADVHLARTASRSVLGHMNDMAFTCAHVVELAGGLGRTDVADLNHRLRRGLHNRGGYVMPVELAASRAGSGRA